MKKCLLALWMAALLALLCGCGTIIVEDAEPVIIGWADGVRMFT